LLQEFGDAIAAQLGSDVAKGGKGSFGEELAGGVTFAEVVVVPTLSEPARPDAHVGGRDETALEMKALSLRLEPEEALELCDGVGGHGFSGVAVFDKLSRGG